MNASKFKPVYISGLKTRMEFFNILRKYYSARNELHLFSGYMKNFLNNSTEIKDDIFLTKSIIFNNQTYTSPIIPAFPSSAFDHMLSRRALDFFETGASERKGFDSILLAISNKCQLNCRHCYEAHNLNSNNKGVQTEKWKETIGEIQKIGVSIIILTGGEPLLDFDKLIELLEYGKKDLSDFHVHTSGNGLTYDMVKRLKSAGLKAAAVGLDDYDEERFDKLRGKKGLFQAALKALEMFNQNGIFTYVNTCVTKDFLHSGDIYKFYDLMKDYNVCIIELLEPKPWGGYINETKENVFNEADKAKLEDFVKNVSNKKEYINHPLIYYMGLIEKPCNMGCTMGGLSHMYIDSAGNVDPCVFLPISFGNIKEEKFTDIYLKMRDTIKNPIKKECPSIMLKNILKNDSKLDIIPVKYENIKKEFDSIVT